MITVACRGAFWIRASSPNESPVVSSVRGIWEGVRRDGSYHVELAGDLVLLELEDLHAARVNYVEGLPVFALLNDCLALVVLLHPQVPAQLPQLRGPLKLLQEFVVLENRLDQGHILVGAVVSGGV